MIDLLGEAGYSPALLEPAPDRSNVLLRVAGSDPSLPGLLWHGHLDVVPVEASQWSVDPFGGEVIDGMLYGRGATDMKDAVAVALAVLLRWAAAGRRPRRDVVFAFVADEEEDGEFGAGWLVGRHPEPLRRGGGGDRRERRRLRCLPCMIVPAQPDGSIPSRPLSAGRCTRPWWPPDPPPTAPGPVPTAPCWHWWTPLPRSPGPQAGPTDDLLAGRQFLEIVTRELGIDADLSSPEGIDAAIDAVGSPLAEFVRPASRCSASPTVLRAGYKVNVVPGTAEADLDVRATPGSEIRVLEVIDSLLTPAVARIPLRNRPGLAAPDQTRPGSRRDGYAAIARHDPDAIVVPYCMGGGTDAKAFAELGIAGYGFTPLGRDPLGRLGSGMRGVDERVPVAALVGGVEIFGPTPCSRCSSGRKAGAQGWTDFAGAVVGRESRSRAALATTAMTGYPPVTG